MIISPVVSSPRRIPADGLVVISCETRTNAGVLTTPATSIKVTLFDKFGATAQAAVAMTTSSAGIHSYAWQCTTAKPGGEYTIRVEAIHSDGTSTFRSEPGSSCNFEVI